MKVYIHELKANFKSLLIWSIGIIFMIAGGMSKYSAASKSGQSMNELVSKMPKTIQSFFGMGSFDLSKAIGFYGVLFLYLAIMMTIHAGLLGATIISKEERDKTSEFLYIKPITRKMIISQKILSALTHVIILNLITLISSLMMVGYFSNGEPVTNIIIKLMIGLLLLQLIFLSLGLGLSAISKNAKNAPSLVSGSLLFFFFIYKLSDMNTNLAFLRFFTPFKYFDAEYLINNGFNSVYIILTFIIIITMLIITYTFYDKRDLII